MITKHYYWKTDSLTLPQHNYLLAYHISARSKYFSEYKFIQILYKSRYGNELRSTVGANWKSSILSHMNRTSQLAGRSLSKVAKFIGCLASLVVKAQIALKVGFVQILTKFWPQENLR